MLIRSRATECWRAPHPLPPAVFLLLLLHEQKGRFAAPDRGVKSSYDKLRRFSLAYKAHQFNRMRAGRTAAAAPAAAGGAADAAAAEFPFGQQQQQPLR